MLYDFPNKNLLCQVCFWCHGIASADNICSCCSCKRTTRSKGTKSCFYQCWFFGEVKTEHRSAVGCCATAQYFSSHIVYFLVASNSTFWVCYVLLYVCPVCSNDNYPLLSDKFHVRLVFSYQHMACTLISWFHPRVSRTCQACYLSCFFTWCWTL